MSIKFPERATPAPVNGDAEHAENGVEAEESPRASSDVIMIIGKAENAEQAKQELLVCGGFLMPKMAAYTCFNACI